MPPGEASPWPQELPDPDHQPPPPTPQTSFHPMPPGEASPWPQELPQPVWRQLPEWCQLALKLVDAVGPQGEERYPKLQVWMLYLGHMGS